MMLQKKSNPWNRAKALIIAPITFLAFALIAMPSFALNNTATLQQEEPVLQMATEKAQFPGGEKALIEFLTQTVKYPQQAQLDSIQGTVIVEFMISKTGEIEDAKVVRSVCPSLDKEAVRVINSMPNWIPGKNKHRPVNVGYTLPIKFSLK